MAEFKIGDVVRFQEGRGTRMVVKSLGMPFEGMLSGRDERRFYVVEPAEGGKLFFVNGNTIELVPAQKRIHPVRDGYVFVREEGDMDLYASIALPRKYIGGEVFAHATLFVDTYEER